MSWSARFIDPIELPGGGKLKTLSDARAYLLKLPKARHGDGAVQTAIECVMMAAEGRGPMMHAEAALHQMLHGRPVQPPPDPARDTKWRKWSR